MDIPNNENYKIPRHIAQDLDKTLDIAEFDRFIRKCDKSSAPGYTGMSYLFYNEFWQLFRTAIYKGAVEIHRTGTMPTFLRKGLLTLLPKSGVKDKRKLRHWRPLILQDTVYKMISGVITARLNKHMDSIIHKDQLGFVPGRSMDEATRIISALIEFSKKANKKGVVLSIDFRKAFDFLDHRYIKRVINFFDFGRHFKKWIHIFLDNYTVNIVHAGHILPEFSIVSRAE